MTTLLPIFDRQFAPRASFERLPALTRGESGLVSVIAGLPDAHGNAPVRSEYAELKRLVESDGLLNPQPDYYVAKIVVNAALLGLGLFGLRVASLGAWWWLADLAFRSFVSRSPCSDTTWRICNSSALAA